MTRNEHIQQHIILHNCLDELVADFISNSAGLPSKNTILDLLQWSDKQTEEVDHTTGEDNG